MGEKQAEFDYAEKTTKLAQEFEVWVHTPEGGQAANLFIRLAIGCKRRGKRIGAKAIWERIRWFYSVRKVGGDYKLNNNYAAYMARFAMERVPELAEFFETRAVGVQRHKDPVFVAQGTVMAAG